ncbi:hypothetical protein GM921_01770 [Pedobacter sp. LMG 31464]|uniref:Dienelactone hydrolase n=1 Tax=Pedobacter planticolens TaxID=2679964 RepID=A0A923DWZ3_9SPHI|nr:hypothetical protein [Pedobacter planticolens]MBB2144200.1 hypothetical protein [Pedobacter planticolens]
MTNQRKNLIPTLITCMLIFFIHYHGFTKNANNTINITNAKSFPQWGKLTKGKYTVGYKDTVIFKTDEQFSYHDYKGQKPFFISIWYPAIDNKKIPFLHFKDYLEFTRKDSYGYMYDSLINVFHHILIKDGICINIKPGGEKVGFDETHKRLYYSILETKVNAKRNLTEIKNKFPCVFYHHGAQSTPYDNNVFCEYMASQGYIVISSNYNLPNEGKPNELTVSTNDKFDNISDMEFVLKLTKKMPNIDTSSMVAVGHSWGAQTEIRFDNTNFSKSFKKIISLHTTLEDKPLDLAKKWWPKFNYMFENACENSTTPVVLFAPFQAFRLFDTDKITGKKIFMKIDTIIPKYVPFRFNKTTPYTFITVKHEVRHDGFISLGNLRFPFCRKYHLVDRNEIIKQQFYYEQIIRLSEKIITKSLNNTFSNEILDNIYFTVEQYNQTPKTK